jgi:hypothetical protein
MYAIYLLRSSVGMLTTFAQVISLELTTWMSATLPPTIRMSPIFGELFLLMMNV